MGCNCGGALRQQRVVRKDVRMRGQLIHRCCRANLQTIVGVIPDIAQSRYVLQVDDNLWPEHPVTHAWEEIGSPHESAHSTPCITQERSGLLPAFRSPVFKWWKTWSGKHLYRLLPPDWDH
jgi:hypothetical protein